MGNFNSSSLNYNTFCWLNSWIKNIPVGQIIYAFYMISMVRSLFNCYLSERWWFSVVVNNKRSRASPFSTPLVNDNEGKRTVQGFHSTSAMYNNHSILPILRSLSSFESSTIHIEIDSFSTGRCLIIWLDWYIILGLAVYS